MRGKKSLGYSTPFYFPCPTFTQYTLLTLYWEVQINIKVKEYGVRVSYFYSRLPPQQTTNIVQMCAPRKGRMEKHSHFVSFLIIWPFGNVKRERILWVGKQALSIWTYSINLYSSSTVICHLNWNSIWEGERCWSTGCQRNWSSRTRQRRFPAYDSHGETTFIQLKPDHYQTSPPGSLCLQITGSSSSCFVEITDTNKKAFTYCMSSWMKMVLKLCSGNVALKMKSRKTYLK